MKYQDLSQFVIPIKFRGHNVFMVQLWWIIQATVFAWSPDFFYPFRSWLLRIFGAKIGHHVRIRPSARITYPWKLHIGNHVWIGHESIIYNLEKITIGSNVAIAHDVYLCTGSHDTSKITFDIQALPINIEDEVWLPNDVFIGPGVTIGRGAVIGTRSSVFSDMPEGMICYGTPAKPIKPRIAK